MLILNHNAHIPWSLASCAEFVTTLCSQDPTCNVLVADVQAHKTTCASHCFHIAGHYQMRWRCFRRKTLSQPLPTGCAVVSEAGGCLKENGLRMSCLRYSWPASPWINTALYTDEWKSQRHGTRHSPLRTWWFWEPGPNMGNGR